LFHEPRQFAPLPLGSHLVILSPPSSSSKMIVSEADLPTLIKQSDHLGVLRYVRSHKLRKPSLVVDHALALLGPNLTKNRPSSNPLLPLLALGPAIDESERLAALEQLCEAALDVHDHNLANNCLTEIKIYVPAESTRVRRLLGLCLESEGDLDRAEALYDDLLKDNPSCGAALKRKYAILKSQPRKEAEARGALNAYLERNGGDASGWAELGDLCHGMGDYRAAAYAYEEVVLSSPLDPAAHRRLGELYATVGGRQNLKAARKHLAQCLELDPKDVRALYGLVAAAGSYLEETSHASKSKREADEDDIEVAKELVKFGAEKLLKLYKGSGRLGKAVEEVLAQQKNSL